MKDETVMLKMLQSHRGTPSSDIILHSNKKNSFLEADMSDSLFLKNPKKLGMSASHPNLHVSTPPSSGLDITEKDEGKFLAMDPIDLIHLRKWIVGFCIVNFDLEIGQGMSYFCPFALCWILIYHPFFYVALDYVYPPMELSTEEQKNM